ncbi:unnamed protein product [Malus baccata var. baccata]
MKAFSTLLKLKDSDKFEWHEEHQDAFTQINDSFTTPHVLMQPRRGKPLKLYILTIEVSVSCLLTQDNDTGQEQAIFYLSRNLNSTEINYSLIEKLCLALSFTASKLMHYMPHSATQVIAQTNYLDLYWRWNCYPILGSLPMGEYEALIIGLNVLHDLRATRVLVLGDSELVINQLNGTFSCMSCTLAPYHMVANYLVKSFEGIIFKHISRVQNTNTDELAQIASGA